MSRSITLNGVKATVIFHDTTTDNPNDKPTINWELIIESGDNKAMIDGSITMDVRYFPIQEVTKEVEAMPNNTPILTREITGSDFKQYIRKCLSEIASTTSRKEKAGIATTMFNYMTNDGLPFVKEYQEFKKTAIDRAYYLKCKETEFEELMESLDAFLVAVGAPLAIPSEYVESEEEQEEHEEQDDRKYEQDEYIDECGYKWHKFVGNLDKNKDNKERIVMLEQLFKKENLTFKMEYMNLYYDWEKTAPRLNRYQKMKAFIHENKPLLMGFEDTDNEERKKLMMSIFKKKNLEFKDVYMDMYYEWQKNAPKENRYKKMCSFIEVQGFK